MEFGFQNNFVDIIGPTSCYTLKDILNGKHLKNFKSKQFNLKIESDWETQQKQQKSFIILCKLQLFIKCCSYQGDD